MQLQQWIVGLCHFLGVTDPLAVSIAVGGVTASLVWCLGYLLIILILAGINSLLTSRY